MTYVPAESRYRQMIYKRCGRSGLLLPRIALGLWHNFGEVDDPKVARKLVYGAFDLGVTHFDLANNYGPPPGAAERTFGRLLSRGLRSYRDELVISTKAGYGMWPGPYGDFGSRKYLMASLDQSLKRLGLDYVDIFYHHRPDLDTPIEETMGALADIVRSGKALYVGVSNYSAEQTRQAQRALRTMGVGCLIHQPSYSLLNRTPEESLFEELRDNGMGCAIFSPLAQGRLTERYLGGIPKDSRAAKKHAAFLNESDISDDLLSKLGLLKGIAKRRGQSLAQLALAWTLRDPVVTCAIIGASKLAQVKDCIQALSNTAFAQEELREIEDVLNGVSVGLGSQLPPEMPASTPDPEPAVLAE